MGYYDYVLGTIPLALLGVPFVLNLLGVPFVAAVPVGGAVSMALVGHAMFVRGPGAGDEVAGQSTEAAEAIDYQAAD